MYQNFDRSQHWNLGGNQPLVATPVPLYYCPSDRPGSLFAGDGAPSARAASNYVVNCGHWGFVRDTTDPAQVTTLAAPFGWTDYDADLKPR